jgi:ribosomal protein S18 acetylase RimI-like enzyme
MEPIGCVVCKIDPEDDQQTNNSNNGNGNGNGNSQNNNNGHGNNNNSTTNQPNLCGYMAMLAVDTSYRRSGIGTALVKRVVRRMRKMGCKSVTLETEVSNKAAMKLYEERLGFVREEFLARYYLNWGDAYRLKLYFP